MHAVRKMKSLSLSPSSKGVKSEETLHQENGREAKERTGRQRPPKIKATRTENLVLIAKLQVLYKTQLKLSSLPLSTTPFV
ncbi:hypothetical protein Mapa_005853 [Marchantia paleacea]|nr:hypothetical protein Mapa_005853 [Marchantia paleacea]